MNVKFLGLFAIDTTKGFYNWISFKVFKKVNQPYMVGREIRLFNDILEKIKPKNILEWGGGYSTLFYPNKLNYKFTWNAIENNKDWANFLKNKNKNKNVKINYVKSNTNPPWSDKDKDGSLSDFKDYISFPKNKIKTDFDLILIDGRARKACLNEAKKLLSKDGIIILHDAHRKYYYSNLDINKNLLFLDGRYDGGGILIFTKRDDIEELINSRYYQKLFNFYNKIGKIPFIGQKIIGLN